MYAQKNVDTHGRLYRTNNLVAKASKWNPPFYPNKIPVFPLCSLERAGALPTGLHLLFIPKRKNNQSLVFCHPFSRKVLNSR